MPTFSETADVPPIQTPRPTAASSDLPTSPKKSPGSPSSKALPSSRPGGILRRSSSAQLLAAGELVKSAAGPAIRYLSCACNRPHLALGMDQSYADTGTEEIEAFIAAACSLRCRKAMTGMHGGLLSIETHPHYMSTSCMHYRRRSSSWSLALTRHLDDAA